MNEQKLEFKVGSLLKNIIGKDLITDDYIAVFELVKNSYDAHAKNVIITFEDNKIIIADDGKGMSLDDLTNKWLFVAYSAKQDGSEDNEFSNEEKSNSYRDKIQVRKHYAGAKGIGRFSCDRLGKNLKLTTKKVAQEETHILTVDWDKFEKDSKAEFQKVTVDYSSYIEQNANIFPEKSKYGTILEITNLSESWDRNKLLGLKHSLEKLINPFSEKNDFNIEIVCERELKEDKLGRYNKSKNVGRRSIQLNDDLKGELYLDRDKVNGKLQNSILEILNLKTTQINVKITEDKIQTELKDRGSTIYEIVEDNLNYDLIDNLQIDLYYLNTSAKNNFTRRMGIQVVNFGSVFLFKNGFRVQPYGEVGDDSWGLDYRAQQGFSRFLGTRNLFGRVDIISNNIQEFKEVSSRDGGLVETKGYQQLVEAFKEKGLKRLERYVVGVLWGEGFKKRNYFGKDNNATIKAESYRKTLLDDDKHSENINIAKTNLGSKLDFIQIIKSLANDKNIKILDYNKELIDLVNDNLEDIKINALADIETIAKKTQDTEAKEKLSNLKDKYQQLEEEKKEAERKVKEEEKRRMEAEKKAQKEAEARQKAEQKEREEREKREKAEQAKIEAENKSLKAENEKLKAEQKAKEEEKKRENAESEAKKRKEQVSRYRAVESIEYQDLRDSNHIIGIYADTINKNILLFKRRLLNKEKIISNENIKELIKEISFVNDKILAITKLTTGGGYLKAMLETTEDIVNYITDAVDNTYKELDTDRTFEIISNDIEFVMKFHPIEVSTMLMNIWSNSKKKKASKIIYTFDKVNTSTLNLSIKDVGIPLSSEIKDWSLIFEEGITTTNGSGLGLSHVKRLVEEMGGNITYNPQYKEGFELIITFKKNENTI